jgi:dTDP-4-amino-4,6-dideoxy-D-glucose ammonia-lyase
MELLKNDVYKFFFQGLINDKTEQLFLFFKNLIQQQIERNNYLKKEFKDIDLSNDLLKEIIDSVFYLSKEPLITYSDLAKKVNISIGKLKKYILLIREIADIQKIIIKKGVGSKYWVNTIIPLLKSESAKNFLIKKYSFPFRVGIFPGLSCMFECTFCGRNYDAVYKKSALESGMEMYSKLIEESPNNDQNRFYISGGLEPLTNSKLTMLFEKLKAKKLNSSLYTNAFMMTENYLKKNQDFFNLNSLRVSFYGVNSEKTFKVTKKKNAFELVTKNIFNYLVMKNEKKSNTLFGLNFIILKNTSDDVIELLKLIIKINKDIKSTNKNNFNFLTLREDFRIFGNRVDDQEKFQLIKNIKIIDKMVKNEEYLSGLFVDYGFALEPLRNGYMGDKFEDNFASFEDIKILGVPQASVAVDLYGDVYLYREAAFLDRPGSKRYIIGNLLRDGNMKNIIEKFIINPKKIDILDSDRDYLDGWDHVTVRLVNQLKKNENIGFNLDNSAINLNKINDILHEKHQVHYSK